MINPFVNIGIGVFRNFWAYKWEKPILNFQRQATQYAGEFDLQIGKDENLFGGPV